MSFIFYFSLALLFYIFLGYPALIMALAALRPAKIRPASDTDGQPGISVLMSVYNEEPNIRAKLADLLSIEYPADKIEFLIGSDGSTDATNEILRAARNDKLKVSCFPERRGKPSVLNELARKAGHEILVFTDCRQKWASGALTLLLRNFRDPKVGVVSGIVQEEKNGFYRRYENAVRNAESRFSSIPGATGAFYGLRRDLFQPLPPDTILDDFFLPMEAVRQGYRNILEPEAMVYDRSFSLAEEKKRKVRTIAGNFQFLFRYPWLWNPGQNPIWFQTFSHKLLRLGSPLLLCLLLLANLALWPAGLFYKTTLVIQALFYFAGIFGIISENTAGGKPGAWTTITSVCASFLELNRATTAGFRQYLSGRQTVTWNKSV